MKQVYLITETHPTRGLLCAFGPHNYFPDLPLHNVNPDRCYKSEKTALNYAAKCNRGYNLYQVIEVPQEALAAAPQNIH